LVCLNVRLGTLCMACEYSSLCVDRPLVQEIDNWHASVPPTK
jgi:hypothetical protein